MAGGTFDLLSSYTVSTAENNIVFTNIPQNYTDLVILGLSKLTSDASQSNLRFNGISNGLHNSLYAQNDGGSGLRALREFNRQLVDGAGAIGSSNTTGWFAPNEYHIFSYSDPNKYKTVFSFGMFASSGNTLDYAGWTVNSWVNTDPITSITVLTNGTAFAVGSQWAIYGIRGK